MDGDGAIGPFLQGGADAIVAVPAVRAVVARDEDVAGPGLGHDLRQDHGRVPDTHDEGCPERREIVRQSSHGFEHEPRPIRAGEPPPEEARIQHECGDDRGMVPDCPVQRWVIVQSQVAPKPHDGRATVAHHRAAMDIVLPDPCLVVLVGAAGAGKSTFAARHFAPDEVLSSDRYRAILSGDASNQAATRQAFGRLHRELSNRLAKGLLTVVDATNVQAWARRALVDRATAAGVPSVAIVLDLSPGDRACEERGPA